MGGEVDKGEDMGKISSNFVRSVMDFEQDITTQERDLGVISIEVAHLPTRCRYLWCAHSLNSL